jgi:hypothetical protein
MRLNLISLRPVHTEELCGSLELKLVEIKLDETSTATATVRSPHHIAGPQEVRTTPLTCSLQAL